LHRLLHFPALSLVVFAVSVAAQQPAITRPDGAILTPAQIDSTVNPLIQAAHVTGTGIALFRNRKVVYLKAYGLRDTEKGLPLTPDSVMTAASLTKPAFATAVMRLVQRGVLDLDRPIEQYLGKPLGEFVPYSDLKGDSRTAKFTLRILLDHTTGFANFRGLEEDRKLRIHYEPGTHYGYSGEGISLAQFVVEKVTGKSVAALMQEELYGPLKMTRSSMVWEARFESDFANGYDEYGRSLGPERHSSPSAAGSMQTTLRDYAAFLIALLHSKPLGIRTTGLLFNRQIAIHSAHQFPSLNEETSTAYDGIRLSYGLGWGLYFSPYGKAFFKEGHDEGWRNLALIFRERGDGILILINSSNGEGIFKPLIDAVIGPTSFPFEWENYTPWDKLPALPPLKQHHPTSLSADQLNRVTGRYTLGALATLTVTVSGDHLSIQENDETPQDYLPESPQDFYSTTSGDECTFRLPAAGPAEALILHLDGKDVELKRVP